MGPSMESWFQPGDGLCDWGLVIQPLSPRGGEITLLGSRWSLIGASCPKAPHLTPSPTPGSHAAWLQPAHSVSRKGFAARKQGSAASAQRPPCPAGDPRPRRGSAVTLLGGHGAGGHPTPARLGPASRAGAGFPGPAPRAPRPAP